MKRLYLAIGSTISMRSIVAIPTLATIPHSAPLKSIRYITCAGVVHRPFSVLILSGWCFGHICMSVSHPWSNHKSLSIIPLKSLRYASHPRWHINVNCGKKVCCFSHQCPGDMKGGIGGFTTFLNPPMPLFMFPGLLACLPVSPPCSGHYWETYLAAKI